MTPEDRLLGARLRKARSTAGFSQEEIAQYLEIGRSAVSALENGRRKVSGLELRRLARVYGTGVSALLGEEAPVMQDELGLVMARMSREDRELVLRYANYVAAHPREEGRGTMRIQVSHSAPRADGTVDWFVVRPLPGEEESSVAGTPITNELAVASLRAAGRSVIEVDAEPWQGHAGGREARAALRQEAG